MKIIKFLKNKNREYRIGIVEEFVLMTAACILCLILGFNLSHKSSNKEEVEYDENLTTFIDNYNYIVNNYYKEVDRKQLVDDAIAGMMKTLDDPYSVYMSEEQTKNINIALNGEYKGLGLVISKDKDGNIIIAGVFENSAADKAGMLEGDIIKKINDKDIKDMEPSDFSNYVMNSTDNEFKMIITREGEEKELTVTKSNVEIDSVSSKVIEENNHKIGYIYISMFALNTVEQFSKKLIELEKDEIEALIIDVREDSGGYLTTVDSILKRFMTKKQVIYQLKKDKSITKEYGKAKENKKYKIVLLGNENSASASELLISGIRENYDNSIFIGKKTYGKGTAQEMVSLDKNNKYKITTKKWLTPKGNWINDTEGIIPDIEVDTEIISFGDIGYDDVQLKRAVEELAK